MLRLVKTNESNDGAPRYCRACGDRNFVRSRIAWNCSKCGCYVPINLDCPNASTKLKRDLEVLTELSKEFKKAIDNLERIVTE